MCLFVFCFLFCFVWFNLLCFVLFCNVCLIISLFHCVCFVLLCMFCAVFVHVLCITAWPKFSENFNNLVMIFGMTYIVVMVFYENGVCARKGRKHIVSSGHQEAITHIYIYIYIKPFLLFWRIVCLI